MSSAKKAKEAAQDTVSAAKTDFDELKGHFEKFLSKHVTHGLDDVAAKAVAGVREVADTQAKDVSEKVVKKPLLSIAISAVIGFIAGRLTR